LDGFGSEWRELVMRLGLFEQGAGLGDEIAWRPSLVDGRRARQDKLEAEKGAAHSPVLSDRLSCLQFTCIFATTRDVVPAQGLCRRWDWESG